MNKLPNKMFSIELFLNIVVHGNVLQNKVIYGKCHARGSIEHDKLTL